MQRSNIEREIPTGRARGRQQAMTGKVVLQIEVQAQERSSVPPCPPPPGYHDPNKWIKKEYERQEKSWRVLRTYFRDAQPAEAFNARVFNFV